MGGFEGGWREGQLLAPRKPRGTPRRNGQAIWAGSAVARTRGRQVFERPFSAEELGGPGRGRGLVLAPEARCGPYGLGQSHPAPGLGCRAAPSNSPRSLHETIDS